MTGTGRVTAEGSATGERLVIGDTHASPSQVRTMAPQ